MDRGQPQQQYQEVRPAEALIPELLLFLFQQQTLPSLLSYNQLPSNLQQQIQVK